MNHLGHLGKDHHRHLGEDRRRHLGEDRRRHLGEDRRHHLGEDRHHRREMWNFIVATMLEMKVYEMEPKFWVLDINVLKKVLEKVSQSLFLLIMRNMNQSKI